MNPELHTVKIDSSFFDHLWIGDVSFIIIKDDREYKRGDLLNIVEIDDESKNVRMTTAIIKNALKESEGVQNGYCILSVEFKEWIIKAKKEGKK